MPPHASRSRRSAGSHSARHAPPRRFCVATALLLLCVLSACAESVSSPHSAVSSALVVHRRRECGVETLARTAFADLAQLSALFDASASDSANASSSSLAVEWTRADACADGGDAAAAAGCRRGGRVALVGGKLSLAAPAARVAAAIPMPRADANTTTTRLRVHAAFPVNTSATATIALTLPQSAVTVSLSVEGARVRLAAPALNWSVDVAPPCALTAATHVHVVDVEWTRGTRWLRWHWDGHLLHEAALPRAHRTRHVRPLRVELSLTGGATAASDARFLVKTLELQRVASGQDATTCRPHVQAPEANCRRHTRFEPRLGADQGYLSLAQVYEFVRGAPAQFPSPQFTKLEEIGVSTQNRSLLALCVGACWRTDAPQVLYTGMHHAREPISMMNLVYTIDLLALDVANGVLDTTALLLSRQLWFVLVVNPDGYARNEELLTWREQRSGQRKNARDSGCASDPADGGVDLNRNYDVCFAEDDVGSSTDPCGEDFRGPAPFSEPETRAIKQFVERNTSHFAVSLNYHSFGRYFNVPFACKALDTPHGANLSVFEAWAREMTRYNGFQYGQPWKDDNLYSVNGETSDWLWAKHGIFAMSPEVGPAFSTRVDQGFWPPREDVPALAVELHYSNLVAARLAGPQYDVVVSNITRQLASEDAADADDIRALLLVELAVRNEGLTTAGDLEIVVTTELTPSNATNEISAFTTTTSVPEAALGTVRDGADRLPVKRVLAIPEVSVVHVVVRDALSCHYIRVTTSRASKNATTAAFQQWAALELPLCGFCGSIGRDATLSATPNHDDVAVCKTVSDLLDASSLSTARASHLKRVHASGVTGETKRDDATPSSAVPAISTEPTSKETTTTTSPPPSETPRAEDTEAPATTKVKTAVTPVSQSLSSSPSSGPAPEDRASTSTNTAASTTASFASFASVPVVATLVLVAVLVFAVVARRRRRASERSAKAAAAKPKAKSGKRKNYVKVVNDEDEAAQLEQRDDDDDEDAEYGRRRNPSTAARARAKSDDDETLV